jgi:hypothetical protein
MKKLIMIIPLLIIGCATTAGYEKILSSWVNADISDLTNKWGYPTEQFIAPNGNRVYVYQNSNSYKTPTRYQTNANANSFGNYTYGSATTQVTGGQTIVNWCRTYFEVDANNKIIRWRWEGNNCVAIDEHDVKGVEEKQAGQKTRPKWTQDSTR